MDRSYLSHSEVVRASRNFICVRLATYEDEEEMEFMNSIYNFRTPSKNSIFAILDPSGVKHLVEPGRSMKNTFKDAAQMAQGMSEIAEEYGGKEPLLHSKLGLPYLKDVRVALNVAACDAQRLVILYAPNVSDGLKLEALLQPLVWHADLIGEFLYATTDQSSALANISEVTEAPGLLVVEPDTFGLEARQVAFIPLGVKAHEVRTALVAAASENKLGSKDSRRHIGRGLRQGVHWDHLIDDHGSSNGSRRKRRSKRDDKEKTGQDN